MGSVQQPDAGDAAVYTGVLRRRWLAVAAGAVLGLAGAFGYAEVSPKTYRSTAEVDVTPTGAAAGNPASSRTSGAGTDLDSEAQLVTSAAVAAAARKTLHTTGPAWRLSQAVSVTVPPNSTDLDVACAQSTAAAAAACANAFANAYLAYRDTTASAVLTAQLHRVETRVAGLEQQTSTLDSKLKKLPGNSPQRPAELTDLRLVGSELHALTAQEASLDGLSPAITGGSVITPAVQPGRPAIPDQRLALPSGLVAGLLLGLVCAFLIDRRDKRIHLTGDIERLLGVPVLADLPGAGRGRQFALAEPRSKPWRAFTALARAVAVSLGEGHHVLAVAGATSGAGGSVVAANLAEALARTHAEVVLVCAGTDDTVAPAMLGLARGPGLAEVLAGTASVRDVVQRIPGVPGLWVITPGAMPALAGYTLQHDVAKAFVAQLREARYVVVDVQATEDAPDTFALAEFADAALLVVEVPRTTARDAATCLRLLGQLRTPVLGAAALPATSPRARVPPGQVPPGQADARLGSGGTPGQDRTWLTRQAGVTARAVAEGTPRSPEPHDGPVGGFLAG